MLGAGERPVGERVGRRVVAAAAHDDGVELGQQRRRRARRPARRRRRAAAHAPAPRGRPQRARRARAAAACRAHPGRPRWPRRPLRRDGGPPRAAASVSASVAHATPIGARNSLGSPSSASRSARLEVRVRAGGVAAQRGELPGAPVPHGGAGDAEVHPLGGGDPLLGLVPPPEAQQVVDGVDVHEAAERRAHAEPLGVALAGVHRRQRLGVLAAQPQDLAQVQVGARARLARRRRLAARGAAAPPRPRRRRGTRARGRAWSGLGPPARGAPASAAAASAASQRLRDSASRRSPISAWPSAASSRARSAPASRGSSASARP